MVNMTGKCGFCSFTDTKNGYWNLKFAMEDHLRKQHPKEQKSIEANNENIERQILELKRQIKQGWERTN